MRNGFSALTGHILTGSPTKMGSSETKMGKKEERKEKRERGKPINGIRRKEGKKKMREEGKAIKRKILKHAGGKNICG